MNDRFLASYHAHSARQVQGTLQGAPRPKATVREVLVFMEPGPIASARMPRGWPSKLEKKDSALAIIKAQFGELGYAERGLRIRWMPTMEVYDSADPADPINEAASSYLGVELRGFVAVVTPPEG